MPKTSGLCDFLRFSITLQRVELTDLSRGAALPRAVEIGLVIPVSIRPGQIALMRTPVRPIDRRWSAPS